MPLFRSRSGATNVFAPFLCTACGYFGELLENQSIAGFLAPSSELPRQFAVSAALDLRGVHDLESVVEFRMTVLEQVLSH